MADLEMWFHLLEQGCFAYIREPLCAVRAHAAQQTERDKTSLAPALENRQLLQRYLHKNYIQLRRWIWKYLEYDAVRRIVRRSRKVDRKDPRVEQAVSTWGGWGRFRRQALKYHYREVLLKIRRIYERHLRRPLPLSSTDRPLGLNVTGFAQGVYGIGESTRAYWHAARLTGLPCVLRNIPNQVHLNADTSLTDFVEENPYRVNLMTFSFDYARRFYRDMGPRFFAGRHNIGLWFWEQENFPVRWHSAFDYYNEIWVATEFVRRSIAAVSPIPVYKIAHPVSVDAATAVSDRSQFGMPERSYIFLFNFDFCSTIERKNPAGLIAAFRSAFRANEPVTLVLKTINAEREPAARDQLGREMEGANVLWIDRHIDRSAMNALFASADCYVSLHRAEGVGLGMAEAMFLGKPVIGTNYSGNLDFMNAENSLLVDYCMTELSEGVATYERGSRWAEPSIEHAAELMRFVYEHQDEAKAIGSRASDSVRATLSPELTAKQILQRLHQIT
jgi:glycosyltransferase involved in cell wall biosynthesis